MAAKRRRKPRTKGPQPYSDKEIHSMIAGQIARQVPMNAGHWSRSTKPVTPTEKSLSALFQLAQNRRIRGKPFFGFGDWYTYIERTHGISPLGKWYMPDERVHSMIAGQIARQVPMNAKHWQTSTEPATPTGQSLQGLYKIARKRFVDGRSFFGHGNWRDYLRSKHKLLIPDHSFGRRKKGYPDEEVHTMISEQLMKQVPTGSEHWRISTEPAAPTGQSLQALYYLARGRRVGGKSFFGYGNWYNYLEQRHRVGSLDTAYLPNARVHSMIARQIANGVSMTTEHWVKSNEPATEAGQSLNNLYQIVRRRRVHGKLFLGYGDWKTYLREAHKVTV